MDQKSENCNQDDKSCSCDQKDKKESRQWQKPVLEDVSGKIMAQPYIRFT